MPTIDRCVYQYALLDILIIISFAIILIYFSYYINSKDNNLREFVLQQSDYHGADDVIIAVGARQAIENATGYINRGGVLNLFGGEV